MEGDALTGPGTAGPVRIIVSNGGGLHGNDPATTTTNGGSVNSLRKCQNSAKRNSSGNCNNNSKRMDGGTRAWLICLSSFLCNGIIFGVINSYSLVFVRLQKALEDAGDPESSSKAALVGSLTIGTTFLFSPVAGVLTDKIGIRWTTVLGAVFTSGGMLISSFCLDNIKVLYLTYGLMYGLGAAFTYSPSLAVLGHYFKRYLGKVNGFVTAGSSIFTAVMPFIFNYTLDEFGLKITLRLVAAMSSLIFVCALLYEAPEKPVTATANVVAPLTAGTATGAVGCKANGSSSGRGSSPITKILSSVINVDNWKKKKYVIWALAITISQFGYFVPYVHMSKFVRLNFPGMSTNLPVMFIGIFSGLGRIIFGFVSDLPRVNRILLQQFAIFSIGAMTLLLPFTNSFVLMLIFISGMGLFDGCFVALLGPIAIDICGAKGGGQAIGFLLGLCSIPLTVGSPVAGTIFDRTGSYTLVFVIAGLSPVIAAISMFLTRCVADDSAIGQRDLEAWTAKTAWTDDGVCGGAPGAATASELEVLDRKASLANAESLSDDNL